VIFNANCLEEAPAFITLPPDVLARLLP